jgi:hypothetical protein
LYLEYIRTKNQAGSLLITDPVATRLWLLILFFSSSLHCYEDASLPELPASKHIALNRIQNSYVLLLWNYLLHRHGHIDCVRIFSNLIRIYLQMQRISQAVNAQLRTRDDLRALNQALTRATIADDDRSR